MADLIRERITSFFEEEGIEAFEFLRKSKHPAVRVTHGGVTYLHAYPGTPSDHRSILNTVSDLRHHLGLVGTPKATPASPARRNRKRSKCTVAPSWVQNPAPAATPAEDKFYSRLAAIKAELLSGSPVEVPEAKGQVRLQRLRCPFLGRGVRYQEIADLRATPRNAEAG